jgi:RHS repeat-associated protein
MQYDARYRMSENKLTGPAGTIAEHDYSYDGIGNITAIADALDASFSRTFGYDDLHRLTTANTGSGLWGPGSYAYDAMGNILSVRLGDPTVSVQTEEAYFRYQGTSPKIATVRKTALPDDYNSGLRVPGKSIRSDSTYRGVTYDGAGNELSYVATRSYSARNLMESVTDAAEVPTDVHRIDYKYDGRGIRVIRSETQFGGALATRYFTYSPELQLLSVTHDDQPNVWGARIGVQSLPAAKYDIVWFGGRPLAQVSSDSTDGPHRYFTDHLGTPILQTNQTASVVWHAEYEPYGDVWKLRVPVAPEEGPAPVVDQPLRFPGQELAMGWEGAEERYNIHRWYRAGWGRYTQVDPARTRLQGTGDESEYGYVTDNPINTVDPLGLYSLSIHRRRLSRVANRTQLPRVCRGQNSCTTFPTDQITATCKCECVQNEWNMHISVEIAYDMYLAPGGPARDPWHETHELLHVQDIIDGLDRYLTTKEDTEFSSQGACQEDCARVVNSIDAVVRDIAGRSQQVRR